MPQIGTIDIQVMEENQSRWLAFQRGEVDIIQLEGQLVSKAIKDGKLRPSLQKKACNYPVLLIQKLVISIGISKIRCWRNE